MNFYPNETQRQELFPVCCDKAFLAHAAVAALPKPVADAVCNYTRGASENHQEFGDVLRDIKQTRRAAAELIGAQADEIALLGPTSLGLSLVAQGLDWAPGDEVLCYQDDYPANVYPWMDLERRGVLVRYLEPWRPGEITPELVEQALTPRTRLVALASCHFFTGYRIDIDAIGQLLRRRGVLFCLDAIQTVGAFPTRVDHVDFLSADAHKWLLGPLAIGIVYVRREHFDRLRPALIGAWNVEAPGFITQDEIRFVRTAQRYEPGTLNAAGIYGLRAAIELLQQHGIDSIAARLLELKDTLVAGLNDLGFTIAGPQTGPNASSITTCFHERVPTATLAAALEKASVVASMRQDREGRSYLRFSPHFYNTEAEIETALASLRHALASRPG